MDLADRYRRAERFLPWNLRNLVRNGRIEPHWLGDSDEFWYRRDTEVGYQFETVNARTGNRQPAFDHQRLAHLLSLEFGTLHDPSRLPMESVQLAVDGSVRFECVGQRFEFKCGNLGTLPDRAWRPNELLSPNGQLAVFRREANLWVRNVATGAAWPLTRDGTPDCGYGGASGADCHPVTRSLNPDLDLPRALWSSDSTRLLSHRLDETKVESLFLLQSMPADGGRRPRLHQYRYPFAGEEHIALMDLWIFDLTSGQHVQVQRTQRSGSYVHPLDREFLWWGSGHDRVYWLDFERGHRSVTLCEIDAQTGGVTEIITETNDTYVEVNLDISRRPNVRDLARSERFIWFSERDGWGHLYLIDRHGTVLHQITRGAFTVRDIVAVDEGQEEILFTAGGREVGRDPYLRHLYRSSFDGSHVELLTPENADHDIQVEPWTYKSPAHRGGECAPAASLSPSGRFLVHTYSTAATAPVTTLTDLSGATDRWQIEVADTRPLEQFGWRWPEPFESIAADGTAPIFGLLFLPSDFDPNKTYPILDSVYPGPQTIQTPKSSFNVDNMRWFMYAQAAAQAELGFAVVMVDGRGTAFRSKAWHDAGYGRLQDAGGITDRLSAIRHLAGQRPYLDLSRLGAFGHSGGGYAVTRALFDYPEVFKAGFASCAVQDMQRYIADWGEKYQGPYENNRYAAQDNALRAHRLDGKLMLVWGELDDNVHAAGNMRVVQALIDAHKDFEMLIVPGVNHWYALHLGYVAKRQWDFFVRWLLHEAPPFNVVVGDNPNFPPFMRIPRALSVTAGEYVV